MTGHSQQVLSALNYQRFYGYHCDLTLCCGDDKYKAHKCILSACSAKLQQMVNGMARDADILPIESVSSSGFKLILDYIYTGVLKLDGVNVLDLFAIAQRFELKDAEKQCNDYYKNGGVINQPPNDTYNNVQGNVAIGNPTCNDDPNYLDDYLKMLDTPQQHDTSTMLNSNHKPSMTLPPAVQRSDISTQTESPAINISDGSDYSDEEAIYSDSSPVSKKRRLQAVVKFVTKTKDNGTEEKGGDDVEENTATAESVNDVNGAVDTEDILDEDLDCQISGELDASNEGVRQIIKSEKQDDYAFNIGNSMRPQREAQPSKDDNPGGVAENNDDLTLTLRLTKDSMSKTMYDNLSRRKASVPMKLSLEDVNTTLEEASVDVMNAEVTVPISVPVSVDIDRITPRKLLVKPLKKRMYTSKHSSSSGKKLKKGRIDKKKYKLRCVKCQRLFKNEKSLKKHDKKMHHREGSFPCDICSINFGRQMELTRHMHTHSRDPYVCPYCEYESDNPWQYKHHMADAHDDLKPFRCKVDGCVFRANKPCNLVVHSAIHDPEKKFKCTKCMKSFAQNSGLRSHLRSCYQERTFSCHLCGCRFNHAQSLTSHMRKHTGEKPFHCEVCSKDFTDHRNYKRHRLIHENIYPYACTSCDKRYRHSNSLKAHLKTHGQEVSGPLSANNPSPHKFAPKPGRPRRTATDVCPPTMVPFQSHIQHMDAHTLAETICSQIQQQQLTQTQPHPAEMKQTTSFQQSAANQQAAAGGMESNPQQPPPPPSQQALSMNTLQPIHHPQQSVTPTPPDHLHHALQQQQQPGHEGLIPAQLSQQLQQHASSLANTMSQIGMPLPYTTNTHPNTSQSMNAEAAHSNLQPPPAHDSGLRKPAGMQHPTDLSRFCSIVAPPLFSIPTHDMLQHMSHPLTIPPTSGATGAQPHYNSHQMSRH